MPNFVGSVLFFPVPSSLPLSKLFWKLKIFHKIEAYQSNWWQAALFWAVGELVVQMAWGWFFFSCGIVSRRQHCRQGRIHYRYRKHREWKEPWPKYLPLTLLRCDFSSHSRCYQDFGADRGIYFLGLPWDGGEDPGPGWLHLPLPQHPCPLGIPRGRPSSSLLHFHR